MQCVNCGFENIPGTIQCVRCQSRMTLEDIEIEPGRASTLRLRTRLGRIVYAAERLLFAMAIPMRQLIGQLRLVIPETIDWIAMAWSIIPGLGHLRRGVRALGWTLMGCWIGFLMLGCLTFPSGWSAWFFAAMVAVHSTAFIAFLASNLNYERLVIRALFGILLFVCLSYFPYGALGSLSRQFVMGLTLAEDLPKTTRIRAGDGLLVSGTWLNDPVYAPGELVLYRLEPSQSDAFMLRAGMSIDRIVAGPGDSIRVGPNGIVVNDTPVEINGDYGSLLRSGKEQEVRTLMPGEYAILPESIQVHMHGNIVIPTYQLLNIMIHRADTIVGRPFFRTWPWSRMGFLK